MSHKCALEVSQDSSAKGINVQGGISAPCEIRKTSVTTQDTDTEHRYSTAQKKGGDAQTRRAP